MQVQLFSMPNQRSECLKLTKNRGKKTAVTVQSSDSARAADELNETNNSSWKQYYEINKIYSRAQVHQFSLHVQIELDYL